jgi:hypothetical protein
MWRAYSWAASRGEAGTWRKSKIFVQGQTSDWQFDTVAADFHKFALA